MQPRGETLPFLVYTCNHRRSRTIAETQLASGLIALTANGIRHPLTRLLNHDRHSATHLLPWSHDGDAAIKPPSSPDHDPRLVY